MKEQIKYCGQEEEAEDWHCTLTTPDICDSGSRSLLTITKEPIKFYVSGNVLHIFHI